MKDKQTFLDIPFNSIREQSKRNSSNNKNMYKTKNCFLNLSSSKKCSISKYKYAF